MNVIKDNLTTVNYTSGNISRIKYIVIHYTGNDGDTALANTNYFKSVNRNASAHYFVDESDTIWRCVEDKNTAWHCGTSGTYYHNACRNANSIGVEMCSRKNSSGYYFKDETVTHTIELVKYLMKKYNIPIENIVRHYDVTHKDCPNPYVKSTTAWENFKKKLVEEKEEIDMATVQELENKISLLSSQISVISNKINDISPMIYNYVDENMPEWARPTISKLINDGILSGSGSGLNLNDDLLRSLVIIDRMISKYCN